MPMYWRDFWADTGHLSPVEGWAYINLIGAYWTIGGPLENDDARLARQAKVSPKEWKAARPAVIAFFCVDDKLIHQKRIDAELAVAVARHAAKVKAGTNGAQKRWQTDSKPIAEPSPCHRQTDAQLQPHSSNDETDANASVGRKRPPPKRASALPADWMLSQKGFDHATAQGLDPATIRAVAQHFRDDNAAKGRTSKDWDASWRTWITKHIGWYGTGPWPKGKQLVSNRQGPESVIAAGAAVIARLQADSGLRGDGGGDVDETHDFGSLADDSDGFADGPCINTADEPERDRRVAYSNEA
jgi:uncharacterized protein YdaU (DUF1376 family)